MCHNATSVVLFEYWWLQMERTLDCYFIVAIVESKEGDMLLLLIVLTIEDSRVVVR